MITQRFFLLALFSIFFSSIIAQTTIASNSQVSGVWKKTASPYYIKGNISVPKDSTLMIEPGVQVRFDGKYMLAVYGNIKALGKQGDSILFYPLDTLNRWRGIRYYGRNQVKDSAVFKYCKFEYTGPKLSNFENALTLKRGNFNISNCVFKFNTSLLSTNSILADSILSLQISNCYFYRNANVNTNASITQMIYGVVGMTGGNMINCIFESNVSKNPYNSLDDYSVTGAGSGGIVTLMDNTNPNAVFNIDKCQFINNQCALLGAGINLGGVTLNGKVSIKECSFTGNFTGRYGCISYVGKNSTAKGNVRVNIENCNFSSNVSANSTIGDGVSCITMILFKSYDTVIIRKNIFESNIARSTVTLGTSSEGNQYLVSNIFRGNALWCISAENGGDVWSINNIYHNNASLNLSSYSTSNLHFRSINDAYVYNGPNMDTASVNFKLKNHYQGQFYKLNGATEIYGGSGGTFRNCIFWQNKDVKGKLTHINIDAGNIYEVSNCIFEGNEDSAILWTNEFGAPRPSQIVTLKQNIIHKSPLFVNAPSVHGPAGLANVDFHLQNTCSVLSPAYNNGLNNAFGNWKGITDMGGNARIVCDTVDIGPYEISPRKKYVRITSQSKDSSVCSSSMFSLAVGNTCASNVQYRWQKRNNNVWSNINNATQSIYSSTASDTGIFRVIVTAGDCNVSDTGRLTKVIQKPSPIVFLGKDTTIKNNQSITLNPGSFNSYLWHDGSTNSSFTVNGNTVGLGTKSYHVTVKNQYGCSSADTINITIEKNSSLVSLIAKGWKVYPNPAADMLNIQNPDQEIFNWILYDGFGRMLNEGAGASNVQIDLSQFSNGSYYLRIVIGGNSETIMVVKN